MPQISGIEQVVMIGDSRNELSVIQILKIAKPYNKVHLDIEYSGNEPRKEFYEKLKDIVSKLKYQDKIVEIDVECWNHDKEYKDIINMCDEFALMNYSNKFWSQMWMSLCFRNKPYYMGIETNPSLKCRTLNVEKRIKEFNCWNGWDNNYLGVAIHCWGYYE